MRYFRMILILSFWLLQSCGNWKSLILQDGSQGVGSVSYPVLYFDIQNISSEQGIQTLPVRNASNTEIAQISVNTLTLSMDTVYLHTDDFPKQESIAKDISFSLIDNTIKPESNSSLVPDHPSGFKEMSIAGLSINLEGTLYAGDEEYRVIYRINFSSEAYLFNDDKFKSILLQNGDNSLILAVTPGDWFQFTDALSDAQIQEELQNLGSATDAQKIITDEILENIQRSFAFGLDNNADGSLTADESNNSDYFSLTNY